MIEQPQPEELTPEQRVKRFISQAKREKWASILLDNASDVTSYQLAARVVKDWFSSGEYDERLAKAKREARA